MNATSNPRTRVCVPVCVARADELATAVARAAPLADVIELRLDCLADDTQLDAALPLIAPLLGRHARPFVFTLRPQEQGGRRALDAAARFDFWTRRLRPLLAARAERADTNEHSGSAERSDFDRSGAARHFVDLELDLFDDARRRRALASFSEFVTLIVSHHDFAGVPADLESIYERAASVGGAIPKLAVRVADATDCLPVARLLERARGEGRDLVALAMGEAGMLTRVLAPALGSFLTYASLDGEQATAPGQITVAELRDLYRARSITERTVVTGLVGSPVSHSLSPHMHNAAFAARGLDAVYVPFETRDARAFARRMARPRTRELAWNLRGFSVTAPHKSAIMETLDEIDEAAREIGAVNTVLIEGGAMRGYNTDADAALAPLRGLIDLAGARVAVIGAGGAARALLWGLRRSGARVTVFARDVARARDTSAPFGASSQPLEGARFDGFDLVVNATPLGTRGERENGSAATAEQLRGARVAYDLVYNPAKTRFLRAAREAGCESAVGGLSMLVAQAAAQFELWTGTPAPVDIMRSAAQKKLSSMSD